MKSLEYMALYWLRFEKRCHVALFERSPREQFNGRPDVIGVTRQGFLMEIEIKRSVKDFKADRLKPHVAGRDIADHPHWNKWPRWFWYLVPKDICDEVTPLVPSWAGLLRGPSNDEAQGLFSIVPAIQNHQSAKLTPKECVRLARCMANQIYSFSLRLSAKTERDAWLGELSQYDFQI